MTIPSPSPGPTTGAGEATDTRELQRGMAMLDAQLNEVVDMLAKIVNQASRPHAVGSTGFRVCDVPTGLLAEAQELIRHHGGEDGIQRQAVTRTW